MTYGVFDAFSSYEQGIRYLINHMDHEHPRYGEVAFYQQRLQENLQIIRQFGDTEPRRAERTRIIDRLNDVSLSVMHISFERLCNKIIAARHVVSMESELYPEKRRVSPNPFGDTGRITEPERFFNRQSLLNQIFAVLEEGGNIMLTGAPHIGKSSLLSMICMLGPQRLRQPYETFTYISLHEVSSEDDFYHLLCDRLDIETGRGSSLTRALRGRYHILCLDEIEKMSWSGFPHLLYTQFRDLTDSPQSPLKLVIASCLPLAQVFSLSSDTASLFAHWFTSFEVLPFPPDVAREFLLVRLRETGITFTEEQIAMLLSDSNGHPACLQQAAANLYRGYTSLVQREPHHA